MNLTDFWYKLVDMASSDKPLFVVGERSITERQFIWILGLFGAILLLIGLRNLALWIVNGTVKKAVNVAISAKTVVEATPTKQPDQHSPPTTESTQKKEEQSQATPGTEPALGAQTPKELLENTSEKRRTLYDYVTPDTIHADVMKQTLNNDFPYQTLKPDPAKMTAEPSKPEEKTLSAIEFVEVPKQQSTDAQLPTQGPVLRAAPTGGINPVTPVSKPATLPIIEPVKSPQVSQEVSTPPVVGAPLLPVSPPPTLPITPPVIQSSAQPIPPQTQAVVMPEQPIAPSPIPTVIPTPPAVLQKTEQPPLNTPPTTPIVPESTPSPSSFAAPPTTEKEVPSQIPPIIDTAQPAVAKPASVATPVLPEVKPHAPVLPTNTVQPPINQSTQTPETEAPQTQPQGPEMKPIIPPTISNHPFNPADPLLP